MRAGRSPSPKGLSASMGGGRREYVSEPSPLVRRPCVGERSRAADGAVIRLMWNGWRPPCDVRAYPCFHLIEQPTDGC